MAVAARPIDRAGHLAAGGRQIRPFDRHVTDTIGAFQGVDNRNVAGGGAQHALIARLPAAVGIKDRAIQDDAIGSVGNDRRLAFSAIGIMSKDFFGHGQNSCPPRV